MSYSQTKPSLSRIAMYAVVAALSLLLVLGAVPAFARDDAAPDGGEGLEAVIEGLADDSVGAEETAALEAAADEGTSSAADELDPLGAAVKHSGTCGECSWSLDSDGLLKIWPTDGLVGKLEDLGWNGEAPWSAYSDEVKSVSMGRGVRLPEYCVGMFEGCSSLASLDVSSWDTSSVKDMSYMFRGCSLLTTLDVSGWDTSSLIFMGGLFQGCSSLTTVDVSNWDTSSVEIMGAMFMRCSSLTTVDVSDWDTSSVWEMGEMFQECTSLTHLDVSGWDTSNVTKMGAMFDNCSSLTTLDLSRWDTSSVRDMTYMFTGCSSLSSLDLSGWDTSSVKNNVDDIEEVPIFDGCDSLSRISVGEKFDMAVDFPAATASGGKWWSMKDCKWYSVDEIRSSRRAVADTYISEAEEPGVTTFSLKAYGNVKKGDKTTAVKCKWNEEWLTSRACDEYNHSLGSTMSVLATAAYDMSTARADLETLGCKDIASYYPTRADFQKSIDIVGYTFGAKTLADGTPCVFVLVRGTTKNIEWESNFNVGTDGVYHIGFGRAVKELEPKLEAFLKEKEIDPSKAKFLVTGHSRGAAVANLLGQRLDMGWVTTELGSSSRDNTFVYTFACPKCADDPSYSDATYGNIFNIVNPEDTVPRLALWKWGFRRYGRTLMLPSKSAHGKGYAKMAADMRRRFRELSGGVSYQPYHEGSQTSEEFEKAVGASVPTKVNYENDKLYYYSVIPKTEFPFFELLDYGGGFTVSDAFHSVANMLGDGGQPVKDGPDVPLVQALRGLLQTKPSMGAGLLRAVFDETFDIRLHLIAGVYVSYNPTSSDVITPFTHAHTGETYVSWMFEGNEDMYVDTSTRASIRCPVDVDVYDESGTLVCRIAGDVVDEGVMAQDNGLAASVRDGVKTIDVPSDQNYTFDIRATDTGTMDVVCTEMDGEGHGMSQVVYKDLELGDGTVYGMSVDEIAEDDGMVSDWTDLTGPDGSDIVPDSELSEGEMGSAKITATVGQGEGIVDAPESASVGDLASVFATPSEGWTFVGWYEGGSLVSDEALWSFRVDGDRTLEAQFAPVTEGPSSIESATVSSIADQVYTGKAITPTPAVKLGSATLKNGTDYALSYKNNVNAGTATVTITGKGNYTGTKSVTFNIVKKEDPTPATTQEMYRLYNPNSGEHFYTAKAGERDYLVTVGWNYEGVGWTAPVESKTPVYRLYNEVAGDHHYTMKMGERDFLMGQGWTYEGIGWYSDDAKGTPLYRQYNPNAVTGSHNYTTNKKENDFLVTHGWKGEGIGWYGVKQ